MASTPPIVGRPPTSAERFWLDWLQELSPEKSIERLDSFGKYLLGTVSTVGTVLTGFGIFGISASKGGSSSWLFLPVVLACLSMAAIVLAIAPRGGRIRAADPDSIRDYFSTVVRAKSRWITIGGVLFALSFASAAAVLTLKTAIAQPFLARTSFTWVRTDAGSQLNLQVKFCQVAPSALIETKVLAVDMGSGTGNTMLVFDDFSRPDSDGNAEVSGKLDGLKGYRSLTLVINATRATKPLYSDRMEILIPAMPSSPAQKISFPTIHFDSDQAGIPAHESSSLEDVATYLKLHPDRKILLSGYCDATGSEEYNIQLSRRRAEATATYLRSQRALPSQLLPIGLGKTNFIASNNSAEGRAENRRVELVPIGCQ